MGTIICVKEKNGFLLSLYCLMVVWPSKKRINKKFSLPCSFFSRFGPERKHHHTPFYFNSNFLPTKWEKITILCPSSIILKSLIPNRLLMCWDVSLSFSPRRIIEIKNFNDISLFMYCCFFLLLCCIHMYMTNQQPCTCLHFTFTYLTIGLLEVSFVFFA